VEKLECLHNKNAFIKLHWISEYWIEHFASIYFYWSSVLERYDYLTNNLSTYRRSTFWIYLIFFSGENVEHSNHARYTLDIKLCDIPKGITLN
jgi:hypothetical protein